ncbi:hypothetical protein MtrunA17_Chr3g0141161 [Medicago truncatula]|uniref:Uncharacterized protein n=1 Tax=Medicago truncatula TaxID=3880 RepID=A0A396J2P1_MEDTR|nr:hypothetical protein MtrunA17_Chr3g0141161 [Medicago truncatula]
MLDSHKQFRCNKSAFIFNWGYWKGEYNSKAWNSRAVLVIQH